MVNGPRGVRDNRSPLAGTITPAHGALIQVGSFPIVLIQHDRRPSKIQDGTDSEGVALHGGALNDASRTRRHD